MSKESTSFRFSDTKIWIQFIWYGCFTGKATKECILTQHVQTDILLTAKYVYLFITTTQENASQCSETQYRENLGNRKTWRVEYKGANQSLSACTYLNLNINFFEI